MTEKHCENCRFFGKIIGLTDATGKSHYKPSVTWGMCRVRKPHEITEKDGLCKLFEPRKEQMHD